MSFIIKRACQEDASALLEYLRQIGKETDNLSFGEEGLHLTVEDEAAYLSAIEHSRDDLMLVAKKNGEIIGSASLNRLPRRMSHRGALSVSVKKEYWNNGIGRTLCERVIAFARENGFAIVDLEVRSDNAAAIHLYNKMGFEKIGTHPFFFNIAGENISFDYMYLRL